MMSSSGIAVAIIVAVAVPGVIWNLLSYVGSSWAPRPPRLDGK